MQMKMPLVKNLYLDIFKFRISHNVWDDAIEAQRKSDIK